MIDAIAVAVLALLLAGPGQATAEEAAERGRFLYRVHCQSCHGEHATGNGPLAEDLKVRPSDLTRIERRRGEFPEEELMEIIDGRRQVVGHGRREMPVWGLTFQEPGRVDDQEGRVAEQIQLLVEYLRGLQVPAQP